jgi:hypothetical protein
VSKIRGSYLYKEDEPVTHVYLVVEGELKVTKKVYYDKPDFLENSEEIFKDPLKVTKLNSKFNVKNGNTTMLVHQLECVARNQFLGIEDIVNGNQSYSSSVYCEKSAQVIAMTKADFLKLQSNHLVWKTLT